MPALEFPNKSQPMRVNYDEMVKGISVSAINERAKLDPYGGLFSPVNARVRLRLFVGEEKDTRTHPMYDRIANDNVTLVEGHMTDVTIDSVIPFKKEDFKNTGRYTLVAELISMEDDDTMGDQIDKISKAIYLEEDPPKHGLFEKMEAAKFSSPHEKLESKVVKGSHESYDFTYNIEHTECKKNFEDRDDLFAYLLRLMIGQIAKIDLKEAPTADKCKIFKPEDFEELDTMAGRERIVQRTMSFVSEALFDSEDES
jgi:hypothetical protein